MIFIDLLQFGTLRNHLLVEIDQLTTGWKNVRFRFAEEELAKHQMSASQKWGFDFVRGCPMDDTKLFLWERVPPTNEIPEMYALSRAAHIRPIDPDRTPSKKRRNTRRDSFLDLYDDLAEQSNRYMDSSKNNVLDLSFEDVDGGHTSGSSCDEDSFEEDDSATLCDLSWMPAPSKLPPSSTQPAKPAEILQTNISISSASNHGELLRNLNSIVTRYSSYFSV